MSKFIVDAASDNDIKQILNVLENSNYGKSMVVLYTRRPNPIKSYSSEGEDIFLSVIRNTEKNKIIATGCCIIRKAFINGKILNTGYLTGFKKLAEYQGKPPYISEIYKHIYKNTKSKVDIYYDSIIKSNTKTQKHFEKNRIDMPKHNFIGEYIGYCFNNLRTKNIPQYTLKRGLNEKLIKFYKNELPKYNFSPISIDLYGTNKEDFFYLCEKDNILASCVLWNQISYKQNIIKKYSLFHNIAKILPLKLLRYPNIPMKNKIVNFSYLSLFFVKNNDIKITEYFIKKVCEKVNNYDYLMIGLFKNHPLSEGFNKVNHIKFVSRIYTVSWENKFKFDDKFLFIDPGLL